MGSNLFSLELESYLTSLVVHDDPLLQEMEERARKENFPIIGPVAGQFCYLITRLCRARRVFEMGSGFGYSTLWFARAVADNGGGEVYHTVRNVELSEHAKSYFKRAGLPPSVEVHYIKGDSVSILRDDVEGQFDLIFVDIDKSSYATAVDLAAERLRPGGVIIMDNMLWSGRVYDQDDQSPSTVGVREATRKLFSHDRFVSSLVPIRDGLAVGVLKG